MELMKQGAMRTVLSDLAAFAWPATLLANHVSCDFFSLYRCLLVPHFQYFKIAYCMYHTIYVDSASVSHVSDLLSS